MRQEQTLMKLAPMAKGEAMPSATGVSLSHIVGNPAAIGVSAMTTVTVNPMIAIASSVGASTVAFINASREGDNKSTPFARSVLATVLSGASSLSMVETLIVAAFGSPSGKNGKAVKTVSALRDLPGGARLYQAHKDVAFILANIDADDWLVAPSGEEGDEGQPGARIIRKAVTDFVLNEGDVKSLFGAKGITAIVRNAMSEHGKALAALEGVEADASEEGDEEGKAQDNAPQSLTERATAMLLALQSADDEAFTDAQTALALLSDYIDTRWTAIADALEAAPEATAAA